MIAVVGTTVTVMSDNDARVSTYLLYLAQLLTYSSWSQVQAGAHMQGRKPSIVYCYSVDPPWGQSPGRILTVGAIYMHVLLRGT